MKWVIVLALLVLRNCISSQPLTNENVRETRQLKFEECCPCPTADRIKGYNVLDTNKVPSDCPCRAADSETASSLFTPTSKAVQSFDRPFISKDEPKPLLNPEVGLASSVLETLREATDQEYEEALARDAAKSAFQVMESDAEEMPMSASTNVFNDILSPRYKETIDAIPEASYNEETRCIYPTLSQINEFGYFEMQPQRNLLKDFPLSKSSGLLKNVFDMDNSPSNVQEQILPAKSKILDDIKMKTDLLKSKLFANNKGMLQRMVPEKSFDKTYYHNPHKMIPDWKLIAPLDNLKSSKLFDSNSPSPLAKNSKNFVMLNNNILRNNMQNNKKVALIPLRKPQHSNKYVTDEAFSSEAIHSPVLKEVQRLKHTKDSNIDSNADTSIFNPVLSIRDDCNLKKEDIVPVATTTEKNDYPNISEANLPVSVPSHYSTEILDTLPSPSEITADENQLLDPTDIPSHEYSSNDLRDMESKPEQITHNTPENSKPITFSRPTDVQDTTNNLSIENSEEAEKYIPETVCTTERSKIEISSFYGVSTPEPITMNTNMLNFPINQNDEENINAINAESNHQIEDTSESHNNLLDENKENNFNLFPNIREGLIKTFENVKKNNEKWQEKIKQDALQLVNIKNNVVMQEEPKQNPVYIPEILAIPHKSNAKASNIPSNTLSSHELQKMSDSILTLSSVNQDSDPDFSSAGRDASETLKKMDSSGEPSEIISCLTPADVYNSKTSEEKPLNNKNKEIIKSGFENQQHFRNLNTGMIYKNIAEQRKSKTPLEKSSLYTEVPRSVRIDENEMAAQASEPKPLRNTKIGLDNSKYLKQDFVVEPNNELDEFGRSLLNVNNFFDNVKSTISNVFSPTNDNIFRLAEDNEDNIDKNYKINNQGRTFDLEKPKLNLKKSAKFLKSPEAIQTDGYTVERYKPNLNTYKARVAVPKSFDVKPILTLDDTLDKRSRTLNSPPNILPNTFAYDSNENVENENLRSLFRESVDNNPNSESTVLSPNIFQNNFRSSGTKNLGSLKDRTEVALQNIHKTLGNPLRAVSSKQNNRFVNKNIGNENLFETMDSKRNEFNEKLQAINLDLSDRLSSLSHRMADSIWPSLNSNPLPQRKITAKSRQGNLRRVIAPSDLKSALANSKLNTQLRQSKDNLSLPKALKESLISDRLSHLKSPRFYENSMSQRRTIEKPSTKSPKTETKTFKPKYKDNKMMSLTSTTRPKTLMSGIKPPQTIKKVSTLIPKTSTPFSEKKLFVSRLKSGEPHSLGSENIMSRVLLDRNTDIDKSVGDASSDESEQKMFSNFKDIKASKQEEARNFALTKLREALKTKMLSRNSNKKELKDNNLKFSANTDLETVPSASEIVNQEIEGSLKQNVQYKCKLLCTKDK